MEFCGIPAVFTAELSNRFYPAGNELKEEMINTDKSWKVIRDSAYAALPMDKAALHTYIVTADGEN